MSYFVFYCYLFICKLNWIDYLGWGRQSSFSAIVYFLLCGLCVMGFSSSSWCLGQAALLYCGTPWALLIIILD